jgi:hypothetical protein
VSNATIASDAGLTVKEVEKAMACLRKAKMIETRWGPRPKAKPGRLIALDLHSPCKALAPGRFEVGMLWWIVKKARARPAALVTAMVGAFMLASSVAGGALEDWADLGCSMADWRRFVGHRDNPSWTRRVRDLESLGLIRRSGRRVFVSPPKAWLALATSARSERSPALTPPNLERARHPSPPAPAIAHHADVRDAPWNERDPSIWVEVFEHEDQHGLDQVATADEATGIIAGWIGWPVEELAPRELPPGRLLRVEETAPAQLPTGSDPRGSPP